jgi:Tat protein translocase TatB subunit
MGSLGFDEMLVVVLVAILVFGKDLPSVARRVGGWYAKLRRHVADVKDEFQRQIPTDDLDLTRAMHVPVGTAPEPRLPGPDPSDPEYSGTGNGKDDAAAPPSSEPATGSTPPDSPPRSDGGGAPPAPSA